MERKVGVDAPRVLYSSLCVSIVVLPYSIHEKNVLCWVDNFISHNGGRSTMYVCIPYYTSSTDTNDKDETRGKNQYFGCLRVPFSYLPVPSLQN